MTGGRGCMHPAVAPVNCVCGRGEDQRSSYLGRVEPGSEGWDEGRVQDVSWWLPQSLRQSVFSLGRRLNHFKASPSLSKTDTGLPQFPSCPSAPLRVSHMGFLLGILRVHISLRAVFCSL